MANLLHEDHAPVVVAWSHIHNQITQANVKKELVDIGRFYDAHVRAILGFLLGHGI